MAHEMIYGAAWKDLIVYPSFVNDSYSSNVAIHPNIVHDHLQFIKVIKFRVDELTSLGIKYSIGRVGEMHQGNMYWRPAKGEELDFSLLPM
ncbi:hypothetical protein BDD43_2052 [Mucilaginibacter gracilis]|uniref:Uncharacterized protein n=1 Tax=Mucilaginibacter gracilis TaxID=423350 RepID=A0A495IZT5_9SPHI|nr:hypothetical protein [Mucilaginibacter gracilis]RKR81891.1 hypothetical protein BDD43_2052 [Mucilaginibacter gracilis]